MATNKPKFVYIVEEEVEWEGTSRYGVFTKYKYALECAEDYLKSTERLETFEKIDKYHWKRRSVHLRISKEELNKFEPLCEPNPQVQKEAPKRKSTRSTSSKK